MSELADQGDALHAAALAYGDPDRGHAVQRWTRWFRTNWPAIAAALRERNTITELHESLLESHRRFVAENDALRVRAETAEADADRLAEDLADVKGYITDRLWAKWKYDDTLAAHAAAVEARPKPYVEEIMSDWAND